MFNSMVFKDSGFGKVWPASSGIRAGKVSYGKEDSKEQKLVLELE